MIAATVLSLSGVALSQEDGPRVGDNLRVGVQLNRPGTDGQVIVEFPSGIAVTAGAGEARVTEFTDEAGFAYFALDVGPNEISVELPPEMEVLPSCALTASFTLNDLDEQWQWPVPVWRPSEETTTFGPVCGVTTEGVQGNLPVERGFFAGGTTTTFAEAVPAETVPAPTGVSADEVAPEATAVADPADSSNRPTDGDGPPWLLLGVVIALAVAFSTGALVRRQGEKASPAGLGGLESVTDRITLLENRSWLPSPYDTTFLNHRIQVWNQAPSLEAEPEPITTQGGESLVLISLDHPPEDPYPPQIFWRSRSGPPRLRFLERLPLLDAPTSKDEPETKGGESLVLISFDHPPEDPYPARSFTLLGHRRGLRALRLLANPSPADLLKPKDSRRTKAVTASCSSASTTSRRTRTHLVSSAEVVPISSCPRIQKSINSRSAPRIRNRRARNPGFRSQKLVGVGTSSRADPSI